MFLHLYMYFFHRKYYTILFNRIFVSVFSNKLSISEKKEEIIIISEEETKCRYNSRKSSIEYVVNVEFLLSR